MRWIEEVCAIFEVWAICEYLRYVHVSAVKREGLIHSLLIAVHKGVMMWKTLTAPAVTWFRRALYVDPRVFMQKR